MIDNLMELLSIPTVFIVGSVLLGLIVGSFLNVVIYRLPLIIESQWFHNISLILTDSVLKKDSTGIPLIDRGCKVCSQIVGSEDLAQTRKLKGYSFLAWPRSECPNCGSSIKSYQNIPVLSWLFLKGKCSGCHQSISIQYPLIELLTGVLSGFVAYQFGFTYQTVVYTLLLWFLITLTFIDFKHYILPDEITIPVIWLGMIFAYLGILPISFEASFLGAIIGYLFFWAVNWGFKLLFKKDGMGYGDFKLLSLLGAWLGSAAILPIILISTIVGSVVGISLILFYKHAKNKPIPFGPYLVIAGLIYLFFESEISSIIPL